MSDSLPENSFSGVLRVVKLTTGEELVGLVSEPTPEKINIKLPAKMENYTARSKEGDIVEYVKLTNYLANLKNYEAVVNKTCVVFWVRVNFKFRNWQRCIAPTQSSEWTCHHTISVCEYRTIVSSN